MVAQSHRQLKVRPARIVAHSALSSCFARRGTERALVKFREPALVFHKTNLQVLELRSHQNNIILRDAAAPAHALDPRLLLEVTQTILDRVQALFELTLASVQSDDILLRSWTRLRSRYKHQPKSQNRY